MAGVTVLRDVPLDELAADPDNPRSRLTDLVDLASSMREVGLLQPIVAREADGHLVVVAGHRRLAAARYLGWPTVPCIVRPAMRPDEVLVAMLVENNQRADLDPIEVARAYHHLKVTNGWSDAQVAQHVGRSQAVVSGRLALMKISSEQQEKVRTGDLLVRDAVAAGRKASNTERPKGIGRGWHLSPDHLLADQAKAACTELNHSRSRWIGGVGCGECWEAVIRADERSRARRAVPREAAAAHAGAAHAPTVTPRPRPTSPTGPPDAGAPIVPLSARRVFDDVEWMAAAGTPLAEIVRATEMPPPRLRELYDRYGRAMPPVLRVPS